jgi:hypothetical protein
MIILVMRYALASAGIAAGVDIAIQRSMRVKYDHRRTLRATSYAFFSMFPQMKYFSYLNSKFHNQHVTKTLVNQFVFCPINISLGIAWNLALQNKANEIVSTVRKSVGPGMIEGSAFWLPINMIGFSLFKTTESQTIFFKLAGIPYKFMFINRTTK